MMNHGFILFYSLEEGFFLLMTPKRMTVGARSINVAFTGFLSCYPFLLPPVETTKRMNSSCYKAQKDTYMSVSLYIYVRE